MNISVIVSTYSEKRLRYVLDCFLSLNRQSLKPYEKILVLDPEKSLIEFYKSKVPFDVKLVVSENKGLSNARNAGVASAKGDIVAFIDDDAVADSHWLENLSKCYEDSRVIGAGGEIRPLWATDCPRWFPSEFYWTVGCSYEGVTKRRIPVRNPIGCNMSFRREVFNKIGYFRSDIGRFGRKLLAGEEAEFSLRIAKFMPNSMIVFEPLAVVYHRVPQERLNLPYMIRRAFCEGVSKGLIASSKSLPKNALSTENKYLRHLVGVAIPSRLAEIFKIQRASQLACTLLLTLSVFIGFASTGFRRD